MQVGERSGLQRVAGERVSRADGFPLAVLIRVMTASVAGCDRLRRREPVVRSLDSRSHLIRVVSPFGSLACVASPLSSSSSKNQFREIG